VICAENLPIIVLTYTRYPKFNVAKARGNLKEDGLLMSIFLIIKIFGIGNKGIFVRDLEAVASAQSVHSDKVVCVSCK